MIIDHKDKLKQLHPDLVRLMESVGKIENILICCTHRGKKDQNSAFLLGKSKVKFPNSRHNSLPSEAVDVVPLVKGKVPWNDIKEFKRLAVVIKEHAETLGIRVTWGGDFTSFFDGPHWELEKS